MKRRCTIQSITSKDNCILLQTTSGSGENDASSVPVKPESQQNQVFMKHKMLLELQQQKLRLKLMQTQAQLKDQQKQLEKQTPNHKSDATSAELSVSTSSFFLSYLIDPVPLPTKGQVRCDLCQTPISNSPFTLQQKGKVRLSQII